MMDVLILYFIEQMRRRRIGENGQLLDVAEGENMNTKFIQFINSREFFRFQNQIRFRIMAAVC